MEYKNIVVFVEFPKPSKPSIGLVKALTFMDVTLVGFHPVTEDQSVNEVRAEHEEADANTLQEIAERFAEYGIRVETELEFGRDGVEARERWASSKGIDGLLLPNGEGSVGRVVVGLRDTRNAERIADFVDFLDRERILHISLIHLFPDTGTDNARQKGQQILTQMKSELVDRGVNRFAIEKKLRPSDDLIHDLILEARSYDLVVLGKTERTIKEKIFGPVSNQIADNTDASVLVIR